MLKFIPAIIFALLSLTFSSTALAANNTVSLNIPLNSNQADFKELGNEKRVKFVEFYVNGQGPVTLSNSNSPDPNHFNLANGSCSQSSTSDSGTSGVVPNCLTSGAITLKDFNGQPIALKDGDVVSFAMYITDDNGQNAEHISSGTNTYDSSKNGGVLVFDQFGVEKSDRQLTPDQIEAMQRHQDYIDKAIDTGDGIANNPDVAKAGQAVKESADKLTQQYYKNQGKHLTVPNYLVKGASWQGSCGTNEVSTALGCIEATPVGLVQKILQIALSTGGGLAFFLMVYGSIIMITSGGSPDNLQRGRTILTSAVAGLLVIILAVFILRLFGLEILNLPGFSGARTSSTSTGP